VTLAGVTRRRAGLILTAIAPAVFAAGCLPMLPMLALDLAPMGLHTIEAATVSAGNSITGGEPGDDEEEDNAKCDQLAGAIPYVTEVKQDADGAIEIRQWGISSESGKTKWTVVVDKNTSPDGWRYEAGFAEMNFSPPLGTELAAEHARYFIFAAAQAKTGSMLHEAIYTTASGQDAPQAEEEYLTAEGDRPVPNAHSDHGPREFLDQENRIPVSGQRPPERD